MADENDPLGRLIDLALYAPVGLFTLAQKELPVLVATGKTRVDNQITLARFIGKMALRQGSIEFKRRLQAAEQARNAVPGAPHGAPLETTSAAIPTPATRPSRAAANKVAAQKVAPNKAAATKKVAPSGPLPIDGYDSLAASQVVLRLGSLNSAELDMVRVYEERNRSRRTILGKIAQLQAR